MSDFIESAKNFMNTAVSRTSWEAQKQLRLRGKQTEIEKLVEQRRQIMDDLGLVAMNLYQQGSLSDSQLSRLCASILELDHDLRTRETQLQEIKNEGYPADQFGPAPTTNYAPPTPSAPPAYTGGGAASASGQAQPKCAQCGNTLRPGAIYCRSCGARVP